MKKFALALAAVFVFAIACGGGGTPDQVVHKLFEGVQNGEGDVILSCLSSEAVVGIDEFVDELKADPEGTAAMAVMFGVEITADEVADLNAARVITILLSSEMITAEMPDFSSVEIGDAVIDGETATVPVTLDGETNDIELILEDGNWKVGGEGLDFM
jgi:methylmalonyl-CoA mutase cobalamin-binding subunit